MMAPGAPSYGAHLQAGEGATIRICAPAAGQVRWLIEDLPPIALQRDGQRDFVGRAPQARAGMRYRLQVDDHAPWPDPWSRWQPDGVHGPSMLIDPDAFAWSDHGWRGMPRPALVCYELHVGTFTPEGTFAAATRRLADLVDLGVTAVELMPVAAFPGTRNWGYDGAALFAPSEQYGTPDDLRVLVDTAHRLGLAVLLDVVYNHLGPDGAYLAAVVPDVFSEHHVSPWGRGINLDGPGSEAVRRTICDNALSWLREFHLDGLRLDATHALTDHGDEHLLAQLTREVRACVPDRVVHLIAEDDRNLGVLVRSAADGGTGLTGVWADDFHHAMRRHLAGDDEAYFSDFSGAEHEIARAIQEGWIFSGQIAGHFGGPRGTALAPAPLESAVICLQNHDQIGNRAHGERLHHQISPASWLAASTLLLTAPETPLLFMGQEWAASSPFLYFTDHEDALGVQVVEGRRREFGRFSAFAVEESRAHIPSPQAEQTWRRSVLRWNERTEPPHAHVLGETRQLLQLRRDHLAAASRSAATVRCTPADHRTLLLRQPSTQGGDLVTVVSFAGSCDPISLPGLAIAGLPRLLYATRPDPHSASVRLTRSNEGALVIHPAGEPFGLVCLVEGDAAS